MLTYPGVSYFFQRAVSESFLLFYGRFMVCVADFMALLYPIFIACVWTVCYADMLDRVPIYVDICVFIYIDIDGCKLYAVDIIIHDTKYKIWYVNVSYSIHIVASLHCICTGSLH